MTISFFPKHDPDNYLNCSNVTGLMLLGLMDIPADYCGSVDAGDLLVRIDEARRTIDTYDTHVESHPEITYGENGATLITQGRTLSQLRGYLDRLQSIASTARNTEHSQVSWG